MHGRQLKTSWAGGVMADTKLAQIFHEVSSAEVTVAGAVNPSSPLARQTTGATLGVTYTWLRSERRAQD